MDSFQLAGPFTGGAADDFDERSIFREMNDAMPWMILGKMTDQDLAAIFAYLKTLKPVSHRVDNSLPPTLCPIDGAMHGAGDQNRKQ